MAIYEFRSDKINRIPETTFSTAGLKERQDLQRLLRDQIDVVLPETLIISEEFGEWEDSKRRIDLLGLDKNANLVVIELKRTEDGGHMDLQAIRYAALVSTMTFDKAVEAYEGYLNQAGLDGDDPRTSILEFLEWEEPDDERFAQDVRIVLVSAEFSKELTSSVMWLLNYDIDIQCVRLKPYDFEGRILVDVQQIIPISEASDYQVQMKEKTRQERKNRGIKDLTRFDITIDDQKHTDMYKRNAIFHVCKYLCDKGVTPEDIAQLFSWHTRVWYSVEGNMDAEQFIEMANKRFAPQRWFCKSEELIQANGKTYAFSNQWGGPEWYKAMDLLKKHYTDYKIDYTPTR
ncbi:MAG: hypothetical protein HY580_00760 [Nitrospinae bacterium]|nr:hypothetical protein [Nitrospinota bacterium]